ncbi:hypothetical protein Ciccas_001198 [Cichlidogyrus casuarinus]|uniref:Uncharacterized protein n=1 Tax=Cichlidogyrus casuarinus TaxID=1844966 RepID=A0ABD2QKS6_9PLAT
MPIDLVNETSGSINRNSETQDYVVSSSESVSSDELLVNDPPPTPQPRPLSRFSTSSSSSSSESIQISTRKKIQNLNLTDPTCNSRPSEPVLVEHTLRRTNSDMEIDDTIPGPSTSVGTVVQTDKIKRKRSKSRARNRILSLLGLGKHARKSLENRHVPSICISSDEDESSMSVSSDSSKEQSSRCRCRACRKAMRYVRKNCESRQSYRRNYSKYSCMDFMSTMGREIQSLCEVLKRTRNYHALTSTRKVAPIFHNTKESAICLSDLTSEEEVCINEGTSKAEETSGTNIVYQPNSAEEFLAIFSRPTLPEVIGDTIVEESLENSQQNPTSNNDALSPDETQQDSDETVVQT